MAKNRARALAYHHANPEKIAAKKRRNYSGWTPEQFEAAWAKQKGLCRICDLPMKRTGKGHGAVHADHDHETRRPRGLLCHACNTGLGLFKESADLLMRAASYLIDCGPPGSVD